jgi:hypothetical protein
VVVRVEPVQHGGRDRVEPGDSRQPPSVSDASAVVGSRAPLEAAAGLEVSQRVSSVMAPVSG